MIRSAALLVALTALSGGLSPILGQSVVAFSCFELRRVQEVPVELPDTLQVVVLSSDRSGDARELLEHQGLVFGQFVSEMLRVAIVQEDIDEPDFLWFRPEGDRMVGWWVDDRTGPPNTDEPWHVEAHRFRCGRLPSG